ncbi:HAD family hydrolase [Conexibacter woesei]|uniref:Haloacid dehalogenase domain protein hydrolase n=1 Tax=Conexibacter woesei (strain DSM 14684 / CCUG 47730 / CIP 108061 / JCM 11494 / NBRC 100937 / ID131577) TaxID=469383 RepID=D3F995_CONWI|nr:HAD hydrolase-like protein [Conexibacter woesei]ADB49062.1 Haloacid dehalogenase domain protein hydrolase [Conexibacter woesei DSM 14684]
MTVTTARGGLLLGLDGVLVDSRKVILRCVELALRAEAPAHATALAAPAWIGPPIAEAFAAHLGVGADAELVARCVATYRRFYRVASLTDTVPQPGVRGLLTGAARDWHLVVVTSKPTEFAIPVLEQLGLGSAIDLVAGPGLEASPEGRSASVARALDELGGDPTSCVLVGDRHFDIAAGRAHGITTVGATWGVGTADELRQAGAAHLARSPDELTTLLAALGPSRTTSAEKRP